MVSAQLIDAVPVMRCQWSDIFPFRCPARCCAQLAASHVAHSGCIASQRPDDSHKNSVCAAHDSQPHHTPMHSTGSARGPLHNASAHRRKLHSSKHAHTQPLSNCCVACDFRMQVSATGSGVCGKKTRHAGTCSGGPAGDDPALTWQTRSPHPTHPQLIF